MSTTLRDALAELAAAEQHYRLTFQVEPAADHLGVGRAWDRMRKAGDKARAALAQSDAQPDLLSWAAQRWHDEVFHRPMVNKNRRTLDDTWRQVIRFAGGDPDKLIGPDHDTLAASPQDALPEPSAEMVDAYFKAHAPAAQPTRERLSPEQCNAAIQQAGLWAVADAADGNAALLRGLCQIVRNLP
jgi:hypothetical protein